MYDLIAMLAFLLTFVGLVAVIMTMFFVKGLFKGDYRFGWFFVVLITLSILGIYSANITKSDKKFNYSTVVDRAKIDYVSEDTKNDRFVWGIGDEKHFEDTYKCKVMIVDTTMYGDGALNGLSDNDLPYYEWQRNLKHSQIKAFGKYFYEDDIEEVYIFYVPRSYLGDSPNPSVDWDSFFESKR